MADTRVFRWENWKGKHYGTRTAIANAAAYARKWNPGFRFAIHATDHEALTGWTDVTEEFFGTPAA